MSRPIKLNADYFAHDHNLRNDRRVKALRNKLGCQGYAIYIMLLEVLTDSPYFQLTINELELELIAGDFDIDLGDLKICITYVLELGLFVQEHNFLFSKDLKRGFQQLLLQREWDRNRKNEPKNEKIVFRTENPSNEQNKIVFHTENSETGTLSDVFHSENSQENEVIRTENTQSKVKYSKVNKSIVKGMNLESISEVKEEEKFPENNFKTKNQFEEQNSEIEKSSAQKEKDEIFNWCKNYFLEQAGGYYWEDADDFHLQQLLEKLEKSQQPSNLKLTESFKTLLDNLPTYWRTKKYTIRNLELNFNEILNEIKTTHGTQQSNSALSRFGRHTFIELANRARAFGKTNN